MALSNGSSIESSQQELFEAQAHVWNHTFNFISSMSLKCAIELGIPDIIHKHGKPMSLLDLVDALPINKAKSNGIYRLMRILVHSKFFVIINESKNEKDEGYWLTPASRFLLRDGPSSFVPFALAVLDPVLLEPFHSLGEWFKNDKLDAYRTAHGRALWEYAGEEPRFNKLFNEAMAIDAHSISRVLAQKCKQVFEGLKSIVDVGGGTGTVARAIADAVPGLKCMVLDLPHVVDGLEDGDNLSFVGGDMFEFVPRADAVLMKCVLHDWNDEECIKILKKCKEAIPDKDKGGKVIIVEIVVEHNYDQKANFEKTETQLFWDMEMLTLVNGKERTEKEYAKLFSAAGYTNYKITPAVLGLRSLIELFP